MRSQEHQQNEANGKDLAEDTNTRSSKGTEKRRERFAGWLGESSGVQILSFASQAAAVITVIVAALTYFWEAPEREKEKHYQAWQAINTAQGQGGSGGRKEALQDLNDDKQSLVSLTVPDAFLKGIDLVGAELDYANFTRATLTGANLREASLKGADLRNVNMGDSASDDTGNANLEGANLENADAREADLSGVNFQGAKLNNAELFNAQLDEAQLQGASLKHTVLEEASLIGANLQDVDFHKAYLWYADLNGADLRGASNLTQLQINDALGGPETQIPEGLQRPLHWKPYHGQLSKIGPLSPGDISTTYFYPSMSFRLGKGWVNDQHETQSYVDLRLERNTALGIFFVAPEHVYDSQSLSSAKTMPVPKDIGTWLENHPYLQADAPTETYIGGIRGKQFNLQATPPENYPTEVCDGPCVPFVVDPFDGRPVRLLEGGYRVIVLSVQDQTVMIVIDLEEGTPAKAEEILKSIEWKGVTTSTSTAGPENVGASSQERHLIQTPNAPDLEAEAEEAAGDYYRAAGSEEWAYTYEYLDSETQSMFTEGEWINKNQWFADNYPVVYHIQSVEVNSASQEPVAEVTLRLTYEDDSTETRNTQFVLEDGVWKHRFMEEEITRIMPDASYEEFVKAKS